MCAFVGAVCHWWHTALQPAQWHARGGLGVARALLPWPCVREAAANASLGGLAKESGGHIVLVEIKSLF